MKTETFKVTGEVLRRTKLGELDWNEVETNPAVKLRAFRIRKFEAVDGETVWRMRAEQSWGQTLSHSVDGGQFFRVASSHYGIGIFAGRRLELLTRQIKTRCPDTRAVQEQLAFTL